MRRSKTGHAAEALLLALALFAAGESAFCPERPSPTRAAARHVLVISLDGLGASFYMSPPPGVRMPNLLRLKEQGSFAEGVVGVYPSVTYPSHTTIVTGRLPAEHGIYSNLSSREAGKNPRDWFWFANAIKVPTLWDVGRRHHLTSAAVSWPVTAGAAIDWNVPEIWDPAKGEVADLEYISKFSTPGLLEELAPALGPPQPGADDDTSRTRLAIALFKKHRPNLLLLHLWSPDHEEHEHGPGSRETAAALERIDARIGEVLAAVKEAGVQGSTNVFIVSDHGFLPTERELRPNVLLKSSGLLKADEKGHVMGGSIATVSNGGSFFIYWPDSDDFRRQVDDALKPLRDQSLLWAVFDPQALKDLGAEPAARLALEAPGRLTFSSSATGELVTPMKAPGGNHGYLPSRKGLEASLIAYGPEIRPGVNLHRIPMTAIGPTLLKALGINDPQFSTQPPLKEIFK